MPNQDYSRTLARNFPSFDFNTQLKACITTCGGQSNLFPTGKRTFTERELACLQGFPTEHRFWGNKSSVIKQIGNAVPPLFAKQLYDTIIKTLRETDAAEAARDDSPIDSTPKTPHRVEMENLQLCTPGPSRGSLSRPAFVDPVFSTPGSSESAGRNREDAIMID